MEEKAGNRRPTIGLETDTLNEKNEDRLQALARRQLTAVAFVLDYLRFEFEDIFLTVLSNPSVEAAGVRLEAGMAGYRDLLCERISQTVTEATEQKGRAIRLLFSDRSTIEIPLNDEKRKGAEAATLQIPNEGLCVWHFE